MANIIDDKEFKDLLDEDILDLLGAGDYPQEKKEELYKKMAETVQKRAVARIYDNLTGEDAKEFDRVAGGDDNHQIDEFLKSKGIDITGILVEEAAIYKAELIQYFKAGQQAQKMNEEAGKTSQ